MGRPVGQTKPASTASLPPAGMASMPVGAPTSALSATTLPPCTFGRQLPSAFFPEEIVLRPTSGIATEKGGDAPEPVASRTASPEVASSLPLVSELLRELWEIRKVE